MKQIQRNFLAKVCLCVHEGENGRKETQTNRIFFFVLSVGEPLPPLLMCLPSKGVVAFMYKFMYCTSSSQYIEKMFSFGANHPFNCKGQ